MPKQASLFDSAPEKNARTGPSYLKVRCGLVIPPYAWLRAKISAKPATDPAERIKAHASNYAWRCIPDGPADAHIPKSQRATLGSVALGFSGRWIASVGNAESYRTVGSYHSSGEAMVAVQNELLDWPSVTTSGGKKL